MEQLKKEKTWIVWRSEARKKGSKPSKVPYGLDGTTVGVNEENRDRWVTYDEAYKACQEGNFDGVGLVFTHGIAGIDMDGYEEDYPDAVKVREIMNTYEEISPSGNGLHHIFKVDVEKLPTKDGKLSGAFYSKNPSNKMEFYAGGLTSRYFTFTGEVVNDVPLEDRTEEAIEFLDKYMRRPESSSKNPSVKASDSTSEKEDAEVISSIMNGDDRASFVALYYDGKTEKYKSSSDADFALCKILATHTNENASQMKRFMLDSQLKREKFEREDYLQSTIEKAIKEFRREKEHSKIPPFIQISEKGNRKSVHPYFLATYFQEHVPSLFIKNVIINKLEHYVYDGGYYKSCNYNELCGHILKVITSYDEKLAKSREIKEAYDFLKMMSDGKVKDSELNNNENIINFRNGILKLDDMSLQPHDSKHTSTLQIDSEWHEEQLPTPVFDRFMETFTGGDKKIEKVILEFMGVAISNVHGYRMKKALFISGKGDSGKSQVVKLMEELLPENVRVPLNLEKTDKRFTEYRFYKKRLASTSEHSGEPLPNLGLFKQLTGGDRIFLEPKNKTGGSYLFTGLIVFAANHLPKFGGDKGDHVYERIIVIPADNVIPVEKRDKLLLEKLLKEKNGIIQKAVRALKEVIENNYTFTEPEISSRIREDYMLTNNNVLQFFKECMKRRESSPSGDTYTTRKVFDLYKSWCAQEGYQPISSLSDFKKDLEMSGLDIESKHVRNGSVFVHYEVDREKIQEFEVSESQRSIS